MSIPYATLHAPHATFVYQCQLPGFEGPLDVLLRLIERQELDITAISLATVADQFVAYLASAPDRDPAVLAEFAAVASRLLLLKTRVLFPRPPELAGRASDDEVDEDELVRHLREYRQIKAAAESLLARDRQGERTFAPLGVPQSDVCAATPEVTLAPARPADLLRAVQRRLARQPATPRVLTLAPRISVGEMAARVLERLRGESGGTVRFSQLVAGLPSRVDVVTAFMAVLELVRRRRVEATQDDLFGEIVVLPPGEPQAELDPALAGVVTVADD
jgi:segregation and condensation protein A